MVKVVPSSAAVTCNGQINTDSAFGSSCVGSASVTKYTQVSASVEFSCALTSLGGVKCWGLNSDVQLGDGTVTTRLTPVDVFGLTSEVAQISTGGSSSCVLTTSNGVKCWGYNTFGSVGDGTDNVRGTPVDVLGLTSGVNQISSGFSHSCALTSSGSVSCWGWNSNGQLGDGTNKNRSTRIQVSGLTSGVMQISVGETHSCALTDRGRVLCWGDNRLGQLGDGTTIDRNTPVSVEGLSGVIQLATKGGHSCALISSGGVKCWGDNSNGKLGDGTNKFSATPVDVLLLNSGVVQISVGAFHTCALSRGGYAMCWGRNNHGQLGDGSVNDRWSPVSVMGLSKVIQMSLGTFHSCAVTSSGTVKCWGGNSNGELGDGTSVTRTTPAEIVSVRADNKNLVRPPAPKYRVLEHKFML